MTTIDAPDPESASAERTAPPDDGLDDLVVSGDEVVGYVRSPSDLLRLLVYAGLTLFLLGLTRWGEDAVIGIEEDLVALFSFLGPTAERILAGLAEVLVVAIGLVVFVPAFAQRRWRLIGYIVAGNVLTSLLVSAALWWLDRGGLPTVTNELAERAGVDSVAFSAAGLAQVAASFIILAPFVTARWRRAGAVTITGLAVLRLLLTAHLPAELFLSLAIGALAGAAVLLLFGRPDQRPTMTAVQAALVGSGLRLTDLRPASVDARGSTPYFATLDDGTQVFAKALSPEERSADLLFRLYRFLRLRNVGDERPFSSLRRTVEHEALVALQARDVGVRTPRMRAIADVGGDSMLLAYDMIDGRSLDAVPDDAVTDELLRQLWEQIAVLRRHRIAHRDLRRANVFVDDTGAPWIIDFGFSEVAASDRLLSADVAQLLAAVSIVTGPDRAVSTAVDVLGTDAVGSSLPLLQPTALSGATRTSLKAHKGLLDQLRQSIIDRCAVANPHYEQLDRVDGKKLFTLATLALATYFLLPQVADVPGIIDQVSEADWAWFPAVLAMSVITYVGATFSLSGAVPQRLALAPTFLTQLGSSFASKLAPAGLGGMALNTRYLQKSGVDSAVAVTSVGLNSVAGLVTHATLLLVFVLWAGRSAFGAIDLPDPHVLLYGVAVVVVLAGIGVAIPAVRGAIRERLLPVLRRSVGGIAEVMRHPGKVALLLGGSALVTLSYVMALYLSIEAFGGGFSIAQVGAIYLTGAAVATAAPTPSGLGALEAAVIAGLVAAGMDNTIAVPAVFLYRLATFWVPILPGWVSFNYLQRHEYV